MAEVDRFDELIDRYHAADIDALIVVGGDGSLSIGDRLSRRGLRVIGVPKTIDNDLDRTFMTFGFDSRGVVRHRMPGPPALHRDLASPGDGGRVMGRYAGWIALHSESPGAPT